jgi:hypothetical protein
LNDIRPKHFIACFHIRQIQIAEHVAKKGEHPVADRMPEEEDAVRISADTS